MINLYEFQNNIKKNEINKSYLFCGIDEEIIKENIKKLVYASVSQEFIDLNYVKFDGNNIDDFNKVLNACETLPFMSDKKIVLIYRADFLGEGDDGNKKKLFNAFNDYIDNIPESCILIAYYVFKNKREKPSYKIYKLKKKCCVVKVDKIIGRQLEIKVKDLFLQKNKPISNFELKLFCSNLPNDMGVIENEVEKLCCYTIDRDIKKEDIQNMYPKKNDDDIFDLVDLIGDKKIKGALEIFNELIYKGEDILGIVYMIERQFKLLYIIKHEVESGKSIETITTKVRLPEFICKKLLNQSKKFTLKQVKKSIDICLNTEEKLKSSTIDKKVELELMIINAMTI
ncbi:DNA polymerase III subunit delta [Clostridium rectalis]|uniref:DNA polymerase III subunit delta n=1 Tax=Clostridium rectalis TaxID=2040295 RepID=UPI000F630698|nr:DNA polymerase III subunit delta [Clostridium rectalis]